jgi:hypothetical protein
MLPNPDFREARLNKTSSKSLILLAHPTRFERVTFAFGDFVLLK